jgi:hypothetical protein
MNRRLRLRPLNAFTPAAKWSKNVMEADGSINGYAAQHLRAADAARGTWPLYIVLPSVRQYRGVVPVTLRNAFVK